MKPLINVLNSPAFHLPKRIDGVSMTAYLQNQFNDFLSVLDHIMEEHIRAILDPLKPDLSRFCNSIIEAVEAHFHGDPAAAFSIFEKGIQPLKPFLLMDRNGGMAPEFLAEKPYYRMRTGIEALYSKGDIFHLPFSKRAKVNNKRYSVAGLPCLYLSNSVYVCWKELDEPDLMRTQISRFEQVDTNLNILDLDTTPNRLQIQLKSFTTSFMDTQNPFHATYFNLAMSTLVNWPLLTACSMQVREANEPFKQEYVIPQLLLQWVMRQPDIAGIRYFSNKATVFPSTLFTKYSNYVFPPKNMQSEYCGSITKWFKLTEPIIAGSLNLKDLFPDVSQQKTRPDNYMIDGPDSRGAIYAETVFGKIECAMQQFNTAYL